MKPNGVAYKAPTPYFAYVKAGRRTVLHQLWCTPYQAKLGFTPSVDVLLQRFAGEWRAVPTVDMAKYGAKAAQGTWWSRLWFRPRT